MEVKKRQGVVDKNHPRLSISRQCKLLAINRSSLYYAEGCKNEKDGGWDQPIMTEIERIMTELPYYGSRKVTAQLQSEGIRVGRRQVTRLLRQMGLRATQPKKHKGGQRKAHTVHPYLLENLVITAPNQVWSTDISYIPTRYGWVYLTAIMDLYSRMILGWCISGTLEVAPCVQLLKDTIAQYGPPRIVNQDQGSQYTSNEWTETVEGFGILMSMAGKGRCYDNIHMERGWRSLKQEEVYLKEYITLADAKVNIGAYFQQYNHRRLHQSLGYKTPASVYQAGSYWKSNPSRNQEEQTVLFCV